MTMNRKQVDWSRFEELADLMFQVARDQDTEIVWGGHRSVATAMIVAQITILA